MAIALAGQVAGSAYATTLTLTRTTAVNNALILVIQHGGTTVSTVTDTAGNTWVRVADTLNATPAGSQEDEIGIYWVRSALAITSLTVNGAATAALEGNLSEWTGMGSLRAVAQRTDANNSAPPSCQVAAQAGDLVIGGLGFYTGATTHVETLAGGFTALTQPAPVSTTIEAQAYSILAAAATTGPTWTFPAAAGTGQVTAAFAPPLPPSLVRVGNKAAVKRSTVY